MCALLLGIVGPYVAKLFAYLVELKIPHSQACPVGHCIDGFVKVLLSEIWLMLMFMLICHGRKILFVC